MADSRSFALGDWVHYAAPMRPLLGRIVQPPRPVLGVAILRVRLLFEDGQLVETSILPGRLSPVTPTDADIERWCLAELEAA